jgi:hypothetical protein
MWLVSTAAFEAAAVYSALHRFPDGRHIAVALSFGVFGLAFLPAFESGRFKFDRAQNVVGWSRWTLLGRTSGTIQFRDITSIALGRLASFGTGSSSVARRLTLHTEPGVVPVSGSATAFRGSLLEVANAIQGAVGAGRASGEPPIVA